MNLLWLDHGVHEAWHETLVESRGFAAPVDEVRGLCREVDGFKEVVVDLVPESHPLQKTWAVM